MKTKLRAFSIGILFATGVMGITYSIVGQDAKKIDAKELQAYANENNLHLLSNEEYEELLPPIDVEEEKEKKKEEEKVANNEEAAKEEDKEVEEKEIEEKEEEPEEKEEENKPFDIKIPEGMATSEVTDLLEAEGIIKSAKEFDEYLEDKDIATKVRAGTFTMKKNMTYKEAAAVLVK